MDPHAKEDSGMTRPRLPGVKMKSPIPTARTAAMPAAPIAHGPKLRRGFSGDVNDAGLGDTAEDEAEPGVARRGSAGRGPACADGRGDGVSDKDKAELGIEYAGKVGGNATGAETMGCVMIGEFIAGLDAAGGGVARRATLERSKDSTSRSAITSSRIAPSISLRCIAQPSDNALKQRLLILRGIPSECSAMRRIAEGVNSGDPIWPATPNR